MSKTIAPLAREQSLLSVEIALGSRTMYEHALGARMLELFESDVEIDRRKIVNRTNFLVQSLRISSS
jgi:hypothetical protein